MINENNLLKSSVLWPRTLCQSQGQSQRLGTLGRGRKQGLWSENKDEDKDTALCPRSVSKTKTSPRGHITEIHRFCFTAKKRQAKI